MKPAAERLPMEVAHVLYLDMEGYSRLSLDAQERAVRDLSELVRGTAEFARHESGDDLIPLPVGDGMGLVFFGDPQSPIRCACEIAAALGTPPRLPLRIGLHSGPVTRTEDISGRKNVTGHGVNIAQRVMDCGDAGHILLSRGYADLLRPLELWAPDLHDLGEVTVKHGQKLFLVNYHGVERGNPVPPTRLRPAQAPSPTNLPFWRSGQFVGRAPTLSLIHDLLHAAPVVLVGLSGLGKTQVALQYAHLHPQDYPGGIFWINAADSSRLKDGFVTLGRSFFDIPEDLSPESCVARLRDRLHHLPQPALLVFDNITEETDLSLLPDSPHCRLLLTAQQKHLAPPGFALVELPKLEVDAALTLLGGSPALRGDDLTAARQIAEDVGRLPVALDILAQHRARLRLGFTDYRRRLEQQQMLTVLERAREKFVTTTGHKGNIYDSIQGAFLSLSPTARTLLAAAVCFAPDSLGPSLLRDVLEAQIDDEDWYEALYDLADASLISEDALPAEAGETPAEPDARRLRLHELVRHFARMQLSEEEHRAHVARLAAVLTDQLQQANDTLDWRSVRSETTHLAYAASECRALDVREDLYPLLIAHGRFFLLHRDFAGAESVLREGLALVERLHGQMHRSRAQALRLLGENAQMQGDGRSALRDAWTALRIARRAYSRDDPERRVYYSTVGFILKEQGQFDRARSFYLGMIAFSVRVLGPAHPDVAAGLNNLGMLCFQQDRLEEAEKHLREALTIEQGQPSEDDAPSSKVAIYWNSLGLILGRQERGAEALVCHQSALAIYQSIHGDSHPDYAASLYYCAVALHALRRWQEAEAQYQEVLHLWGQLFGEENFRCTLVQVKMRQLALDREDKMT